MKKSIVIGITLLTLAGIQVSAQATKLQKPVKTGNEWKMPADAFNRSKAFANDLQTTLGLNPLQTKKVYDAFLANTKPLDEISVLLISEKEKEARFKANKAAFNEKLKEIFTAVQYTKYLKTRSGK